MVSYRWLGIAAVIGLIIYIACIGWIRPEEEKSSKVFSQGDAFVAHGKVVEKLLVVNGSAFVEGQVSDWVAVINGRLVVRPAGSISGNAYVLNGDEQIEPGAFLLQSIMS